MNSAVDHVSASVFLDLVGPFAALLIGSGATVGLTHAKSSIRRGLLPAHLALVYRICSKGTLYLIPHHARLLAALSTGLTLHWIDIALVSRWTFDKSPLAQRESCPVSISGTEKDGHLLTSTREETTWLRRLWWGILSLFESRRLNTLDEAKNVPVLPSHAAKSRSAYIRYAAVRVVVCYLLVDLLTPYPAFDAETNAELFALSKIPVFTRLWKDHSIPLSELAFRAAFTFSYWFVSYVLMTFVWTLVSVIAVGTGFHEPREWKPFFASISHSYNLRGLWGKTWHQGFRYPFSNPAKWIVQVGLGLGNEHDSAIMSWIVKYAEIVTIFALSGILHVAGDYAGGDNMRTNRTMQFFFMQALGMMFEDHVRDLFKALRRHSRRTELNGWEYAIGYLWCASFMIWTTPQWIWPCLVANTADLEPLLPFSFVKQIVDRVLLPAGWLH